MKQRPAARADESPGTIRAPASECVPAAAVQARSELQQWLPAAGVGYRWAPGLGGFRKAERGSPNVALRHPSFRGYADYMATEPFRQALAQLVGDAGRKVTAIMCAETLWWRCHRRLIADAATMLYGADVWHLGHGGRLSAHRLTAGVRLGPGNTLVYDAGQAADIARPD